ncbi:MAG: hypothetical protein AB7F86_01750 [Bdellovibrionales bacterium]
MKEHNCLSFRLNWMTFRVLLWTQIYLLKILILVVHLVQTHH